LNVYMLIVYCSVKEERFKISQFFLYQSLQPPPSMYAYGMLCYRYACAGNSVVLYYLFERKLSIGSLSNRFLALRFSFDFFHVLVRIFPPKNQFHVAEIHTSIVPPICVYFP
jgi:hypothetical protein